MSCLERPLLLLLPSPLRHVELLGVGAWLSCWCVIDTVIIVVEVIVVAKKTKKSKARKRNNREGLPLIIVVVVEPRGSRRKRSIHILQAGRKLHRLYNKITGVTGILSVTSKITKFGVKYRI